MTAGIQDAKSEKKLKIETMDCAEKEVKQRNKKEGLSRYNESKLEKKKIFKRSGVQEKGALEKTIKKTPLEKTIKKERKINQ